MPSGRNRSENGRMIRGSRRGRPQAAIALLALLLAAYPPGDLSGRSGWVVRRPPPRGGRRGSEGGREGPRHSVPLCGRLVPPPREGAGQGPGPEADRGPPGSLRRLCRLPGGGRTPRAGARPGEEDHQPLLPPGGRLLRPDREALLCRPGALGPGDVGGGRRRDRSPGRGGPPRSRADPRLAGPAARSRPADEGAQGERGRSPRPRVVPGRRGDRRDDRGPRREAPRRVAPAARERLPRRGRLEPRGGRTRGDRGGRRRPGVLREGAPLSLRGRDRLDQEEPYRERLGVHRRGVQAAPRDDRRDPPPREAGGLASQALRCRPSPGRRAPGRRACPLRRHPRGVRRLVSPRAGRRRGRRRGARRLVAGRPRPLLPASGEPVSLGFVWRLRCASAGDAARLAEALAPLYASRPEDRRPRVAVRADLVDVSLGAEDQNPRNVTPPEGAGGPPAPR